MKTREQKITIKDWAPEDQPREKLLKKGRPALSDAELIAILLCTGTTTLNAMDVAKELLKSVNNNLHDFGGLTVKDFTKIAGIGEAKALTLMAALELGRRRVDFIPDEKPTIASSQAAYDLLQGELSDAAHEQFWVILLNRANRVIKKCLVSQGGVSGTVADPKIIFKAALDELACSVILAHNHPSGNREPSMADRDLTQRLKAAGKLLDIQVLDHIIVAGRKYFSFADEGLM
ncbi:RadC family protein [Chryseolinea soli]|uniref:JAB domain-containing protein n=1 Tax=Chryseolinea soli TaxID=2321403 RepID=A0A385SH89_9BACT|nr:DNA repair protein RadC [Chryseolinea soli]AYB29796.1 JAB domain-containing protein [Chryseolinea soli]